jgi:hypothetical protein
VWRVSSVRPARARVCRTLEPPLRPRRVRHWHATGAARGHGKEPMTPAVHCAVAHGGCSSVSQRLVVRREIGNPQAQADS